MSMRSLEDLYVHELKDLYSAEKQLTEALPKMVEAANSPKLREAFSSHLEQTKTHFDRVHALLEEMDENPGSTKCDAMEGLIEEGKHAIEERMSPAVKDAALIAAAQRVEHYEISAYGTATAFAKALGKTDAANTLQGILNEEYDADNKLDKLAQGEINAKAAKG